MNNDNQVPKKSAPMPWWNAITRYHVIGALLGWFILLATLDALLGGPETLSLSPFAGMFGTVIGGALGGMLQMWRENSSSHIPAFLMGVSKILLMVVLGFIVAWFGKWAFGENGPYLAGLIFVVVVIAADKLIRRRRLD